MKIFGVVFMVLGGLMFWGFARDLAPRWEARLIEDGYGTPAQVQADQAEQAAFPAKLSNWQARDAQRRATAKEKLLNADDDALEKELDALREAADDWEPRAPSEPMRPLPESSWARFTGLSTSSRTKLFAALMVAPVPFMIGFFIALGSVLAGRGRRPAEQLPTRPWLQVSDWAALRGLSDSSENRAGIVMMLFVFGWAAFCVTLMWALEPAPQGSFTFVMFMADLCALIILALAVRRLSQGFKYGKTRLLLAQVPIEPGKTFSSRLLVPAALASAEKLEATLKLQRVVTSGTGKNARTDFSTLFERELVVLRSAFLQEEGRWAVELRFEIPADQPSTASGLLWTLEVDARTPGLDFEESFEVPVYALGNNEALVRTDWRA